MLRVDCAEDADVLIVNTWILAGVAQRMLRRVARPGKRKERHEILTAVGCLISRHGDSIQRQVPQVDGLVERALARTPSLDPPFAIQSQLAEGLAHGCVCSACRLSSLPRVQSSKDWIAPRADRVFLKIADGCDRPCAFCIISRSKAPIIQTISRRHHRQRVIQAHGIQEITLVAQDTTAG